MSIRRRDFCAGPRWRCSLGLHRWTRIPAEIQETAASVGHHHPPTFGYAGRSGPKRCWYCGINHPEEDARPRGKSLHDIVMNARREAGLCTTCEDPHPGECAAPLNQQGADSQP